MELRTDRLSKSILIGFGAIIVALIGFAFWLNGFASRQETKQARTVLERRSERSVSDIKWCLTTEHGYGLNLSKIWQGSADKPEGLRGFNHATNVGVVIYDRGDSRQVAITTSQGRPLRAAHLAVINDCLRPSSPRPASSVQLSMSAIGGLRTFR